MESINKKRPHQMTGHGQSLKMIPITNVLITTLNIPQKDLNTFTIGSVKVSTIMTQMEADNQISLNIAKFSMKTIIGNMN